MKQLIQSLREHGKRFSEEKISAEKIVNFLEENNEKSFHNFHWEDGHITASMFVVNEDFTKVLMILHHKFQKWLQFGGHSDDSPDVLATAIREFHEESGITHEPRVFSYYTKENLPIFDLDIHDIAPDAKGRPRHLHYDIRFLGIIPESVDFSRHTIETDDMRWFMLDEAEKIVEEDGLLRMLDKIKIIKNA